METLPDRTVPAVPVVTKVPAPHRWFTAFWVILVTCFALILLAGLSPICFDSCSPIGALNFVLIAIPSVVVALVALLVHRGLRSNHQVARGALILAGVFTALAVLTLVGPLVGLAVVVIGGVIIFRI